MIHKVLSQDYPTYFESEREEEEGLEDEDEEQRWRSREAFVMIALNLLRRMKKENLADSLQNSKRISLKM